MRTKSQCRRRRALTLARTGVHAAHKSRAFDPRPPTGHDYMPFSIRRGGSRLDRIAIQLINKWAARSANARQ